ncbi:MAG TPA: hypothetical protein VEY51_10595 [Chondromyces sp.]|nr:hypothetical protein [Chondromyces sp.]
MQAYRIDNGNLPESINDMVAKGYLREDETACPNGDQVNIETNGAVSIQSGT